MLAFYLFYFAILICLTETEDVCFSTKTNLCYFCRSQFYNINKNQELPFEAKFCSYKSPGAAGDRIVFVSPRPFPESRNLSAFTIYEDLMKAFYYEDLKSSPFFGEGRRIMIKLLKNLHYVLPSDLGDFGPNFFLRNNIEVEISALMCPDAPPEMQSFCHQANEYSTIKLKTNAFTLFISKKLTIKNVVLDGEDLPFYFNNDPCENTLKSCCREFPASCKEYEGASSYSLKSSASGLIVLEPIFDVDIIAIPILMIKNSQFISHFFQQKISIPTSPTSLILIYDFLGVINLEDSTISNCFFPTGIILKAEGFRPFYDYIIINPSTFVFSDQISEIIFYNVSITNYNTQNFALTNIGPLKASLFNLNNFRGMIKILACYFFGNSMSTDYFIFFKNNKPLLSESLINITGNTFLNNIFAGILFISDSFKRDSVIGLISKNNIGANMLKEFIFIKHVKSFNVSGVFNLPFILPSESFINSFHSNLNIINTVFANLQTAVPEYALVKVTSFYALKTDTVFSTAKRKNNIFFSNETTKFMMSDFANSSFLLFNSPNLNYRLSIEQCNFDNFSLYLHELKPFVDLASEGPFIITRVSFRNFLTKSSLVVAWPFLNASIHNLSLDRINVNSHSTIYFFSFTLLDKFEHQLNISEFQANNLFFDLVTESLGSVFIGVLNCRRSESGMGPSTLLSNLSLKNIHYNIVHSMNIVIRMSNSGMKANNISGFNISNSIFFIHYPTSATSDISLNNMQFYNPSDISLLKLLDCGVSYYTRGEFTNSKFSAGKLILNNAVGFNLAQTLILRNISFDLYQESGTLLFSKVSKLSTLFVTEVYVKGRYKLGASLFTIATEGLEGDIPWNNSYALEKNLLQNAYNGFGVFNSIFEDAFGGAIVLLVQTQIIFQNTTFRRTSGMEGGVINLALNCIAVFFLCNFNDSSAYNFGGAFSLESSKLILISVKLQNSTGKVRGGVINAYESVVIIRNSSFENGVSLIGGFVFADSSIVNIFNSVFKKGAVEKYGGHIFGRKGELIAFGCLFEKGESNYLGGSLFLEGVYYNISNAEFISCESKVGIVYTLNGDETSTSIIMYSKFIDNKAIRNGGVMYLNDINVYLLQVLLKGNSVETGYLCVFFGSFFRPKITFEFLITSKNKGYFGIYSAKDVDLYFSHVVLAGNNLTQGSYFCVDKSNLKYEYGYFTGGITEKRGNLSENILVVAGRMANITILASVFQLQKELSMLSCMECIKLTILTSCFFEGRRFMGGVFNLRSTKFFGDTLYITNSFATQGGGLYAIGSSILFTYCLFNNNVAEKEGSDIYSVAVGQDYTTILTLVKTSFLNISKTSTKVENQHFSVNQTNFYGKGSEESQALVLQGGISIFIESSEFKNFFNKSVVYIENKESAQLTVIHIISSAFTGSAAPLTEGAFLKTIGKTELLISQSIFLKGHAFKGGSLYLSCPTTQCLIELKNNKFMDNMAENAGGAVSSESLNLTILNCIFVNNQAFVGRDTNFFPTDFVLFLQKDSKPLDYNSMVNYIEFGPNENCSLLEDNAEVKVVPGYKFSIGVVIIDKNRNIQLNEDSHEIMIFITSDDAESKQEYNVSNTSYHSFNHNLAIISKGVGIFENIYIIGKTNESIKAQILYTGKNTFYKIKKNISIKVQKCHRGDSYTHNICIRCPEKLYSLNPFPEGSNQSCLRCPDNSYCPGGDIIIPNVNYFRKDYNSSKILECKIKKGCPVQPMALFEANNTYKYKCQAGYEGNMCEACSTGYGNVKNQCVLCREYHYLFSLLIFSGFLIYLYNIHHQEKTSKIKYNNNQDLALIKILTNHNSVFVLLAALKINWSDIFKDFITITYSYASSTPSSIFSIDCFFEWTPESQVIDKMIFAGIFPFLLNILSFIINILIRIFSFVKQYKNQKDYFQKLIIYLRLHLRLSWVIWEFLKHFSFIFLNTYPQVLLHMFNVFGCKSIDDTGDLYLSVYPWISCHSEFHKKTKYISGFFLIFWAFLCPALIIYFAYTFRKENPVIKQHTKTIFSFQAGKKQRLKEKVNINEIDRIKESKFIIYNFLTKGYNDHCYWWEVTVFCRKLLFLAIVSLSDDTDNFSIGAITILFLSFFLIVSLFYKPYDSSNLLLLEAISHLVSVITISMGLIINFRDNEVSLTLKEMSTVTLIISNISFFMIWLLFYFTKLKRLYSEKTIVFLNKSLSHTKARLTSWRNTSNFKTKDSVKNNFTGIQEKVTTFHDADNEYFNSNEENKVQQFCPPHLSPQLFSYREDFLTLREKATLSDTRKRCFLIDDLKVDFKFGKGRMEYVWDYFKNPKNNNKQNSFSAKVTGNQNIIKISKKLMEKSGKKASCLEVDLDLELKENFNIETQLSYSIDYKKNQGLFIDSTLTNQCNFGVGLISLRLIISLVDLRKLDFSNTLRIIINEQR